MARAIERWFARSARDLPWRRRRTPYTALVSEFMLQQTQVSRAAPAYRAFLRQFPTIRSLARADDDSVLAAWQGLGYYRRALQLRDAAIAIRDRFAGRVPRRVEQLRALPGVGPYTAGAIASIVFGERAAIVDGNVRRVLLRIAGRAEPSDDAASRRRLWRMAQQLVEQSSRPGRLNEGLMELGAVICAPDGPRCAQCPLATMCSARRQGLQHHIPAPRARPARRTVHHHVVVIRNGGRVLLEKRTAGLWRGMWQPTTIESAGRLSLADLRRRLPVPISAMQPRDNFLHRTTHLDIKFHAFEATSRAKLGNWIAIDQIRHLPLSNPQRRILTAQGILRNRL